RNATLHARLRRAVARRFGRQVAPGVVLAPCAGMSGADRCTVVIVDGDAAWERLGVVGCRLLRIHPKDVARLEVEDPAATIVTLAAPGAVEVLAAWRRGNGIPPSACISVAGSEHVVWLRGVTVVRALRPADPIAVHVRRRRRAARVVAAGGNAGALL